MSRTTHAAKAQAPAEAYYWQECWLCGGKVRDLDAYYDGDNKPAHVKCWVDQPGATERR